MAKRPVNPKRVTVTGGSYHVTGILPIPDGKTKDEFIAELNEFMDQCGVPNPAKDV